MYSWPREYITSLSFDDAEIFYREGKEIDLRRRGFDLEEKKPTMEEREAAWETYYTEEERNEMKKYMGLNKG